MKQTSSIVLALAIGVLLLVPTRAASADPLSVAIMPTPATGAEGEALRRAQPLLATRLTSTGRFVMLADTGALERLERSREEAMVSPVELREAQLREARRSFATLAVELNLSPAGRGRWLASLTVFDTGTSEGIHADSELLEQMEDAATAAQVGVDTLARRMVSAPAILARERGQRSQGGRLEVVDVTPTPVSVRIQGRDAGFAPGLLVDLPVGPVSVELSAPGYQTWSQSVELASGSVSRLVGIRLEPARIRWSITADRNHARIAVDGEEIGRTRAGEAIDVDVPVGASVITVALDGYVPWSQRIGWQSQESQDIRISLQAMDGPDGMDPTTADCTQTGAVDRLRTCRVQRGEALMGDAEGRTDAQPQRMVTLSRAFRMHRDEVRVEAWRACVEAGACPVPSDDPDDAVGALSRTASQACNWGAPGRGEHPMNCVSWAAARTYCEWAGGDLPTEAQWERAARGVDGRLLPWDAIRREVGDNDCDHAHHGMCSAAGGTRAVGERPTGASPWGINDLLGNIAEWTRDRWDASAYRSLPADDPHNDEAGRRRVVRGGSWRTLHGLNAGIRARLDEDARVDHVGFRCVFPE